MAAAKRNLKLYDPLALCKQLPRWMLTFNLDVLAVECRCSSDAHTANCWQSVAAARRDCLWDLFFHQWHKSQTVCCLCRLTFSQASFCGLLYTEST